MILAGCVTPMGRREMLVGEPEEKRPIGEPRCNVRIILK
jgi:hypothetical protein